MKKVLVIYGPTATGKTDLALQLARKFHGELISADSRQVYKGLDIGTGKVSFESKVEKHEGYWVVDGVRINGFDLVDPGKQFTVSDFLKFTTTTLFRIDKVGKRAIIVGGTGFYIKALIGGIDSIGISANQKLRSQLEKLTVPELYQKLQELDPSRAKSMNQSDRANPRRLIRAIEIASSGAKFTTELPNHKTAHHLIIGLTAPNTFLFERVDNWVDVHLKHGIIEETARLVKSGVDPKWLNQLGLYYRWTAKFILGEIKKEEMIAKLKSQGHDYVKRQKTWFPNFADIKLYDISDKNWQNKLGKTIKDWYNQENDPAKYTD